MADKIEKQNIKLAKEALKSKNWPDVLAACKAALDVNQSSFTALVMSASALKQLGNTHEAVENLEKAVKLQPDQPTAWQGLATLLENAEERPKLERLEVVYSKLLDFFANDEGKIVDFLGRLLRVRSTLEHYDDLVINSTRRLSILKGSDREETLQETYKYLAMGLLCRKDPPENLEILKEAFIGGKCYEDSSLRAAYARLLEAREDWVALQGLLTFINDSSSWKAIYQCRLFIENEALNLGLAIDEKVAEKAAEVCEIGSYSIIAKGALQFKKRNYVLARKWLVDGINKENFLSAKELYYRTLVALGDWSRCVSFSKAVLELGQGDPLLWKVRYAHGLVCNEEDKLVQGLKINEETVKKVLNLSEQIPDNRGSSVEARCHVLLGSPASALQTLKLKPLPHVDLERSIAHIKMWEAKGEVHKAESLCKEVVQEFDDWRVWLTLGILLTRRGEKEEGLAALKKALQLNPESWEVFYHLAESRLATEDYRSAQKLLNIALQYRPGSRNVYQMALGICEKLDDVKAEMTLLETYCERSPDFEAWLRLGVRKIEKEDGSGAVLALQNALRLNPKENSLWTLLGEAYMLRGSFTTAIKALTKAFEIDPSPLPLCLLGKAHLALGEAEEAAMVFEKGIKKFCTEEADHFKLAFNEGLAEAQFLISKTAAESARFGRSLEYCRYAYATYMNLARDFPEISLVWAGLAKTAGWLADLKPRDTVGDPFEKGKNAPAFDVAVNCWVKVSQISPKCDVSLRNLSLSYIRQADYSMVDEETDSCKILAVQAAVNALELQPGSVDNWIVLGFAAFKKGDFALSQHAYVKALNMSGRSAEAWVGLGVLYLANEQLVLAHKAFAQAHNSDPGFAPAWIGQGIIAEAAKPEEAMDLFRHALSIGGLDGAARGYGEWVINSLKQGPGISSHLRYALEGLHAVSTSAEHFEKMKARERLDMWSTNAFGLLLERQGLRRLAKELFEKACELASESGSNSAKDAIFANLARCHVLDGEYDSAIANYSMIGEATAFTTCALGLAQYLGGYKEEAVSTLEGALSWLADSPTTISAIQEAMAKIKFEAGDVDGAIDLLRKSSSVNLASTDPIRNLVILLTIKSRTSELEAAVKEMRERIGDRMPTGREVLAISCGLDKLGFNALTFVKNEIFKWPLSSEVWAALTVHLTTKKSPLLPVVSSSALALSGLQDGLLSVQDLVGYAVEDPRFSIINRHLVPWIQFSRGRRTGRQP